MMLRHYFDRTAIIIVAGAMILIGLAVMLSGCTEDEQQSINCYKVELTVTVDVEGNYELILPIPSEFKEYKFGKDHSFNESDIPIYAPASMFHNISLEDIGYDIFFIRLNESANYKDSVTGEALSESALYLCYMRIFFTKSFSLQLRKNMTGDRNTEWSMSDWIYSNYTGNGTISYGFHDWTDNRGHAQWLSMGWGDKQTLVYGWHRYQFAGVMTIP